MKDISFSNGGFSGRQSSLTITAYDTVAELYAESLTGLSPGYYSVSGAWITYWDGSVFSPELATLAGGGFLSDEGWIDFELEAAATGTQLFLAPAPGFPGIRDFAGTYTDAELTNSATLPDQESRGMYLGNARLITRFPAKAGLQITGDGVFRVMLRHLADHPTISKDVMDYGTGGETEATNFVWNVNLDKYLFTYFNERGAGVDERADWLIPQGPLTGREHVWEFRRASGAVTAWWNGLLLRRIVSSTGGTANADGSFTVAPTGGGSGQLAYDGMANYAEVDMVFAQVLDTVAGETAAEFAADKVSFTAAELNFLLRDDFTARAADASLVALLEPTAAGLVDRAPSAATFSTNPACTYLLESDYWTVGNSTHISSDAKFQIAGDLTINVLVLRGTTTSDVWVEQQATGETLASNFMYYLGMTSATTMRYFHETGAGATDVEVVWTVPTCAQYEIREYRLVRLGVGGGQQTVRLFQRLFGETAWTQLTVTSVTPGSGAGTDTATVSEMVGGSSTTFRVNRAGSSSSPIRQIAIYNAALVPS